MKYTRREFLFGLGALGGICLLGGPRKIYASADGDFDVLVVGDSLVSGQGLREEHKFHTLVTNWLERDFFEGNRDVLVKNLSHSGAKLFLEPKEIEALSEAEKDPYPLYHKEVTLSFPSSKSQIDIAAVQYEKAGKSREDIDLVLLTGSLTDIDTSYILNGFKKNGPLKKKIERHCNEGMFRFLKHATGVFPNALFTVIGYFPMLSNKSDSGEVYNTVLELYKFPGLTKPVLNNLLTKQVFKIIHGRMTKRSRIWFEGSTAALKTAVRRINEHNGTLSAIFVESPIPEERSFETKESLLWGMGKKGRSEDDLFDIRVAECPLAIEEVNNGDLSPKRRFCELSGIGHPNREGSKLYAQSIQKALATTLAR